MRLFLDERQGSGQIQCPECGRPLLLGAERRGRWVVGYEHLYLRPGRAALLVCPNMECDHVEHAEIAAKPDDAISFSSRRAAWLWSIQERSHRLTMGEIHERIQQIARRYQETENPKLPSAIRYWREKWRFTYWSAWHSLNQHKESGEDALLDGKHLDLRGRVLAVNRSSAVLQRSDTGEEVLVDFADIHYVYGTVLLDLPKRRFDFSDGSDALPKGEHCVATNDRFVMVAGQRLALDWVSKRRICAVRTEDPEVARTFGLLPSWANCWSGEIPLALAERGFKSIRHCYVQGYRLHFSSATTHPEYVKVETRNMEAARALKMHRHVMRMIGTREQLDWWRFVRLSEIERWEEKQIPIDLEKLVRLAERR